MNKRIVNPYSVLGVNSDASEIEIKRAYRKLCKIYHPDKKGGSSDEFRKISEAYELLTSPSNDKRSIAARRAEPAGFDPFFSSFVKMASNAHSKRQVRQLDIRLSMDIPIHLAFGGGEVDVSYVKNIYSDINISTIKSSESLQIPKRMENGFKIKIKNGGHKEGGRTGDLIVFVGYPRTGDNFSIDRFGHIRCRVEIPLESTLLGEKTEICPFGKGEIVFVQLDSTADRSHRYVLKGEGMKPKGDLILEVVTTLPANISEEDKKKISEILKKYATMGL